MDIINIISIIVAPIIAVWVGQSLQNRAEKRKDKMQIFKILMTSRIYGWTTDSVNALNLIDIVFAKDKSVRTAWKNLFEAYSSTEQSELMVKKRKNLMYKLLEQIAQNIGYKNKITWETIQNPYIPQGIVDQINTQNQSQQAYFELLQNISSATSPDKKSDEKK